MSEEKNVKATLKAEEVEEETEESEEEAVEAAPTMAQIMHDPNDPVVTIKKLLDAGVHLGHPTRKWNPKMKPFIFCARNNIYVIDLIQTQQRLGVAYNALKQIVADGGKVLFVGTKQQVSSVVEEEAIRSGSFYVSHRWLGGILTNFKTIQARIKYLKDLELQESDGSFALKTKKEAALLVKEKVKLLKNLEGIKEMRKLPNALVVVDPSIENNAVREAKRLGIPVFAIVDTNCSPDDITYLVPGNDDASKSVKLLLQILADAIVEAKGGVTSIAYTKDEGEDATMKDCIKQVDKDNAARLAALREQRKLKQEAYEKSLAERAARFAQRQSKQNDVKKPSKEEAPATEDEVEESASEEVEESK
jgi:small subunit ribosomal protein S2